MFWDILFGLLGIVVVLVIIAIVIMWGAVAVCYAYYLLRETWDHINNNYKR